MQKSKLKLKPHIHKIKGAKHYTLYDVFDNQLYRIPHDNNVAALKDSLMKAGLVVETKGVLPFKVQPDFTPYLSRLGLEELQIRLNGQRENNCIQRKILNTDIKELDFIFLESLKRAFNGVPINVIHIEALYDQPEHVFFLIENIPCRSLLFVCKNGITDEQALRYSAAAERKRIGFSVKKNYQPNKIDRIVDFDTFFLNQVSNNCLHKKAAVDFNGDIKYCLWGDMVLGHIDKDEFKTMFLKKKFETGWGAVKDTIDTCMDCEFRYFCQDCRVTEKGEFDLHSKPHYCDYSPY